MPRYRDMPIVPDDIGTDVLALGARALGHQDRAPVGQCMGHGNKIVLPAYTADDLAVFEAVGDHRRFLPPLADPIAGGLWLLAGVVRSGQVSSLLQPGEVRHETLGPRSGGLPSRVLVWIC